ncbi:MAG: AraC family transcriptional regulator ligand-binding domain-containing protein [Myxococcaceae bacterium]|nr:AraC family transcriptional regulator ligand-binding domain-containing protein [Myxococcaceae bacterium]
MKLFDLTLGVGPLRPLAAQLEACGVEPKAFFAGRGIDVAVLAERDGRVPIRKLIGIWERAAEAARDPHFGRHAGERLEPGMFGVVSDVCEASATLGDALSQLSRYLRIVTETVTVRVDVEGRVATVEPRFRMPPFAQGRQAMAFTVAALEHFIRTVVSQPVAVRCTAMRLELDAAALKTPLKRQSPERAAALDVAAHRVLTAQPRSGTVGEQVARVAMGELRLGVEPVVDGVAAELATSVRSLQRALSQEGTTYVKVVDALRYGLAQHHLGETELSIDEVAFVLGFSETAAFYRAFKRWSGTTPALTRAALQRAPAAPPQRARR